MENVSADYSLKSPVLMLRGDDYVQGIAEFTRVPFNWFLQDSQKTGFIDGETNPEVIKLVWNNIKMPEQIKKNTYVIYLPYPFSIVRGQAIAVPTGIMYDSEYEGFLHPYKTTEKYGMRLLTSHTDKNKHILVNIMAENMCMIDGDRFVCCEFRSE